ncbi:MAG TPA: DUF1653 domain-containing protein [Candidatus Saccharimonadales bacterium]|nr:DUF1653 domain-containing protein [Candidatus Saccharimonadales bacterium]
MPKSKPLEEILDNWKEFARPRNGQRFQHYKGGIYEVVATGFIENSELPCVVYRSLKKNIVWVRTAEDFLELIEDNGVTKPRFKPLA